MPVSTFTPILDGYNYYAAVLSLLDMRKVSVQNWFLYNYFFWNRGVNPETQYSIFFEDIFLNNRPDTCTLFELKLHHREEISADGILDFYKEQFDAGYAVYTFLNRNYLPHTDSFQKYDYNHSILLCGHEPGYILARDFFNRKHQLGRIEEGNVRDAYANFAQNQQTYTTDLNAIYCLKPIPQNESADFHALEKFKTALTLFLEGMESPANEKYTGVMVYNALICNQQRQDIRDCHIVMDWFRAMDYRLHTLSEVYGMQIPSTLFAKNNELLHLATRCQMLLLKYHASGQEEILDRMKQNYLQLKEETIVMLLQILEMLPPVLCLLGR